ncbi:dendritic cell protein [Echinococcus multilocularis]|uniref:Dendritic cell protein n=1 Tax=Echinococcus multilocularis TaxID=6211 RepID=A0A068YAH5_ECHMU|nr:dendritic cell protein [Echinococcus multilocularis]
MILESASLHDNTPMAPPTFIRCSESTQIVELRSFLVKVGVENVDNSEVTQENWPSAFISHIPQLRVCFRSDKVSESEAIDLLTTVSSLVIGLPDNYIDEAVNKLCELYEDFSEPKNRKHFAKLYSLNVLFTGLPEDHHSRYRVYRALVTCASELGALSQIYTQTEKVAMLLKVCKCSPAECQSLWRRMSEVHQASSNTKLATQAMINLLSTYSKGNAAGARDDALKCILAVIQDPSFLSHNRLMSLKPLLEIYVSGGLGDFAAFMKKNPTFLAENGLNEKACLDKLRTLSLMNIAENAAELDYATVCKKIDLPEDQLEAFIIEAVRQRVITCKLDQINKRILITGALPRNFGAPQWQSLCRLLKEWESGLRVVQSGLAMMIGTTTQ